MFVSSFLQARDLWRSALFLSRLLSPHPLHQLLPLLNIIFLFLVLFHPIFLFDFPPYRRNSALQLLDNPLWLSRSNNSVVQNKTLLPIVRSPSLPPFKDNRPMDWRESSTRKDNFDRSIDWSCRVNVKDLYLPADLSHLTRCSMTSSNRDSGLFSDVRWIVYTTSLQP